MTMALMALLSLLSLPFLLAPLRRGHAVEAPTRQHLNVLAYQRRLQELDDEVANGLLPESVAGEARAELELRLVDDVPLSEELPAAATEQVGLRATLALVAALLAMTIAGWWATDGEEHFRGAEVAAADEPADVDEMLERLQQHLAENPADIEGWTILGQARFRMRQFEAAADAYARVNRLTNRSEAQWLVAEGEALAMAAGRNLQGHPESLFREALLINPASQRGLWYAGLAAFQREDWQQALADWERLQALPLPDDLASVLGEQIAVARARAGLPEAAETTTETADDGVRLQIRVDLAADHRRQQWPDAAVLFVFARAVDGPAMPLAAVRQKPGHWPLTVELSDESAMLPGMSLSVFDRWEIVARISMTGEAKAGPGDLEGRILLSRDQAQQEHVLLIADQLP